jgi:hypothetical protein
LTSDALLYQLIAIHFPGLLDLLANQGRSLPDHAADFLCDRFRDAYLSLASRGRPSPGLGEFVGVDGVGESYVDVVLS